MMAPELPLGRQWPGKNWTLDELGADPRKAGYRYAKAYLDFFLRLPLEDQARLALSWDNEEFEVVPEGRVDAYNLWRLGFVDAHREYAAAGGRAQLSTGARTFADRVWDGRTLAESIKHIPAEALAYLNETGGWVNGHIHDRGYGKAGDAWVEGVPGSDGIRDNAKMHAWLDEQGYTNIRGYIGEYSFQRAQPWRWWGEAWTYPTPAEMEADYPVILEHLALLQKDNEIVFWYQIDDHKGPEYWFSGTSALKRYDFFRGLKTAPAKN